MNESDTLSEYNKIPLGHNRPMAPFTPKSTALHFRYSIVIPRFIPALILLNPNHNYNHDFLNKFDYKHFIYSDYLLGTVAASAHIIC